MTEYIERKIAIEAFENGEADVIEDHGDGCDFGFGIKNIKDTLNAIPTADVEPVAHGQWLPVRESEITGWNPEFAGRDPVGGYQCSVCGGEAIYDCDNEYVLSQRCPYCGAKLTMGDDYA